MRIAIGSDHAAIDERLALIEHLRGNGHDVNDFGCPPGGAVDYPDVHFVLVDGYLDGLDNVASLVFREQEGSFLVGAIAALTSETGTLGFVGGMDVPLIHKFEAGYKAGAAHVRRDVVVLVGYAGVRPEAFADPDVTVVQMRNHGQGIIGADPSAVVRRGVFFELACWLASQGRELTTIPDDEAAALREYARDV